MPVEDQHVGLVRFSKVTSIDVCDVSDLARDREDRARKGPSGVPP